MHTNFLGIVHHDPGSAYGVSFPDIPDCFAAADEADDILKHAIDALDDYFSDGHQVPAARGIEDITAEFAEDLAQGAFLISVPLIPRPTKPKRVNVMFDRGLLEAIDEAAERRSLNRSAFLAMAAQKEITGEHNAA